MASSLNLRLLQCCLLCMVLGTAVAHLSENFYSTSCPKLFPIVEAEVKAAVAKDRYMGAPLMKLHFKDCFMGGCDGSILLNDSSNGFAMDAASKVMHMDVGHEVIERIKVQLEQACPGVVSCADILAIVSRDAIVALGGPTWPVQLGRRDSTGSQSFPLKTFFALLLGDLETKMATFKSLGFTTEDYVALLGGHTVGRAQCLAYRTRIYAKQCNIDSKYAEELRKTCPVIGGGNSTAPLDVTTPYVFDNAYYTNLINKKGLLDADQELYNAKGGITDPIVTDFSINKQKFFDAFVKAFIKVGNMQVLTGNNGEIRTNCRRVNDKAAGAAQSELEKIGV